MNITICEEKRLFLLSTNNCSYGMEITPWGSLINLHWGARLDRIEDLPYGDHGKYNWYMEQEKMCWTNQEYAGAGGYFYYEPCLKVLQSNGCRDTKLLFQSYQLTEGEHEQTLIIEMKEEYHPMTVRLYYRVYEGLDILDRWTEIVNTGDQVIYLESAQTGTFSFPRAHQYQLTHMSGKWGGEYNLEHTNLTQCKTVVESRHGISGPNSCPWFALDEGRTTEVSGEVWGATLHWSGNWKLSAEVDREKLTRITFGINDYDFGWKLGPGETFTCPIMTAAYSASGYETLSHSFHQYCREHVSPQHKVKQIRPVIFNGRNAFTFHNNEQQQMKLADLAAQVGTELFVVDDGWFGKRDSTDTSLGDWYPGKTKFPNGLKPLIDHVNQLGMDFGIWIAPEMTNADSDLCHTHPDWVLQEKGKKITAWKNQYVLNLAREDVFEYIWGCLEHLLSTNNIRYLKWDMNRYLCEVGWPQVPMDAQREVWTRYVYNVHRLLERIQKNFPDVLVENCASGGGRIDYSMAEVTDYANISDNSDPLDNMNMFEGYTQLFLPKTGTRCINTEKSKEISRNVGVSFRSHLAMMMGFGISLDLLHCTQETIDALTAAVTEYKGMRGLVQNGVLYRLASVYNGQVGAYEFADSSGKQAILFVFGRSIQYYKPLERIRLRGLIPEQLYRIDGDRLISGQGLMEIGIEPVLTGDYDDHVFRIEPVEEQEVSK